MIAPERAVVVFRNADRSGDDGGLATPSSAACMCRQDGKVAGRGHNSTTRRVDDRVAGRVPGPPGSAEGARKLSRSATRVQRLARLKRHHLIRHCRWLRDRLVWVCKSPGSGRVDRIPAWRRQADNDRAASPRHLPERSSNRSLRPNIVPSRPQPLRAPCHLAPGLRHHHRTTTRDMAFAIGAGTGVDPRRPSPSYVCPLNALIC